MLQAQDQERLINLFNSAWEYSCYDITDDDVEFILSNGGYFTTNLTFFDIPLNAENIELFKEFMSEKEYKEHLQCVGEANMILFAECRFTCIEDAHRINDVLSKYGEESMFTLVIKGVDEDGKEHYASITEWMFD